MERVNQVWSTDITYIRMAQGFVYLVAVMDWFSRFVLSWSLSLTMEVEFCVEALQRALRRGRPEIFNSDQGSQFTSEKFTGELAGRQIAISMDGRGRCMDNIFVERLWRSLKYEEVYLKDYASVAEARARHRALLPVLQPRALAPEPRLPDAGGDLLGASMKPEGPTPRHSSVFFPSLSRTFYGRPGRCQGFAPPRKNRAPLTPPRPSNKILRTRKRREGVANGNRATAASPPPKLKPRPRRH